jgi:hypothetical protein
MRERSSSEKSLSRVREKRKKRLSDGVHSISGVALKAFRLSTWGPSRPAR